jgi:two-component system phosphate regulon sensor histidine kinase PhoR
MTARVAMGDLAHRASVRRRDELGELAESLNSMAAQLETREEQLGAEIERSSRVLAAMTEGVVLVDADGQLLRSNPTAEQILGTKLTGAEGSPLVVVARSFPAKALTEKAKQANRAITEVLELSDGRSLNVEVVPLQKSGTDRQQTLFVIRDESARRATERMRRDFATNVSHELKTPLAGLTLLADTLSDTVREDPDQAERFVARLSAEITRLTELTNDLLTLSHLEEPNSAPGTRSTHIDLSGLAAEVLEEVRPLAEKRGHELALDVPTELGIIGDAVSLRTLVRNLLENAIRYTEPGGHIALRCWQETDNQSRRWALLSVRDDGVGISVADQQRIFERFYRVDKARSRETGGTGLGLSIVRHNAERHGGHVEVRSTLRVGSTFTVRLPSA